MSTPLQNMSLLCVVSLLLVSACEQPDTPLPTGQNPPVIMPDTGIGNMPDAGMIMTPDMGTRPGEQIVDELGHGEDKEPGKVSEQGTFHGWWTAVITEVETPAPDPESTEFEADYTSVVGQPFLSAELIHSVGANEGAGGYILGGGSGVAGASDSFATVQFDGDVMTLTWLLGEGKKPFTLTTTERVDDRHFTGTIRSEFDPEGLIYIIDLEKLPETETVIDPDPDDQQPAPIEPTGD